MRHLYLLLLPLLFYNLGHSQQIAFPGAEGYGKFSTGGRGGIVITVTNLNDSGEGSLRHALTANTFVGKKRTIIFKVSGIIELESPIMVRNDAYITIAGQTAPGDGICTKNFSVKFEDSHDIIVRYLRFRPGDQQPASTDDGILEATDAMSFRKCYHIIVDHCSMSWSIDSVLDLTVSTGFSTIQWCMLYEPLVNSRHPKGAHSYIAGWDGSSYGGGIGFGGGSYHHNLLASGRSRTPRLDKYADGDKRDLIDIVNNVIYNWSSYGAYGGENADVNWQNNYYKWGPETSSEKRAIIFLPGDTCRMYVDGNFIEGYPTVTNDNSKGIRASNLLTVEQILQNKPYPVLSIDMQSATDAFSSVLTHAGAVLPSRDSADKKIIQDVLDRTGKHIDSPTEVGGWPTLESGEAPQDSDNDGMPDFWEEFKGLNPNNDVDINKFAGDGYTMLEKYLNAIEFSVPVKNLNLKTQNDNTVLLTWDDTYMNEDSFIIERAENGDNFDIIGEVDANTTSFNDNDITDNNDYSYRIKVKTDDWETTYSDTAQINILTQVVRYITPEQNSNNIKAFPNPGSNEITFSWKCNKNADVSIEIFSLDGTKIKTLAYGKYKQGFHSVQWNGDDLNGTTVAPGIYLGFFDIDKTLHTLRIVRSGLH